MKLLRAAALLSLCIGAGGCHSAPSADGSSQPGADATDHQASAQSSGVPTNAVVIEQQNQSRAGILIAPVVVKDVSRTLSVPGQVAMDEKHTQHIGALADGRIERVMVLPGDTVTRGQTLATLHSHTVHETVAALVQAFAAVRRQESAVAFAVTARDRYARLYSIQAASLEEAQKAEQELAQAKKDLVDAQANVKAEREHLGELLQVPPDSLKPDNLYNRELIPVRAVEGGVVITRNVTVGQVVNAGDELFVVSNLATVWVNASVNEKDVPSVHPGANTTVALKETGADPMPAKVATLGDMVDDQTRTLPVRVLVPNPGIKLRPGMFVTAAIAVSSTRQAIFVPSDALQDINGFRVVFTTKDGKTFTAQAVKTGTEANGMVEVLEGLLPQSRVVTKGAFMVKGELLKGTVGEG